MNVRLRCVKDSKTLSYNKRPANISRGHFSLLPFNGHHLEHVLLGHIFMYCILESAILMDYFIYRQLDHLKYFLSNEENKSKSYAIAMNKLQGYQLARIILQIYYKYSEINLRPTKVLNNLYNRRNFYYYQSFV